MHAIRIRIPWFLAVLALAIVAAAACNRSNEAGPAAAVPSPVSTATPAAQALGADSTQAVPSPAQATDTLPAVPTATPTASPTATATPLPTDTPTATPTATPTRPPSEQLAAARQLHDNGNYREARLAYAALLREIPQGPEADEARWRLGLAYLEDGEPTEAMLAFEQARQATPAEALPPEVDFWLGQALDAMGLPAQAAEAYGRYLDGDDTLAADVHLRRGRALLAAGDREAGTAALEQALATAPDNFVRFAALEELAKAAEAAEDWPAALARLDEILAASQSDSYRAEITYRAGQVLERAGDVEGAAARYRQVLAEDEKSPFAFEALNALATMGQPVDDLTRGRVLLGTGYVADGIQAIYTYFQANPDHPAYPHELVAEAYFGQRNYTAALAEWQTLLDTHPEYTDRGQALIRMAVAQGRLDNTGAARDLFKEAAAQAPDRAADALLEAARLAEWDHDCETAAREYLDVARVYPTAAAAGEALLRGGLCQYRLGQKAGAVESWQRLVAEYPQNTYAHTGRFWAGKALLELGQGDLASEMWQGLWSEAPDSYYTARAVELARADSQGSVDPERLAGADPVTSQEGEAQSVEQWLASWAAPSVADPATLRALPDYVAGDPQLARAETYLRLGQRAEALRELDGLRERYADDPLALYPLALHLRDLGAYRHATLAAVRLGALSPDGLFQAPPAIQRLAYPTYFSDLVEAEAAVRSIDPLLIYALIRQESFFERGARSWAAAQGLTQVIPSTAEWIAEAIGWTDFQADDIYKPYINVKFGTYYLSAALEMFGGNPYPALVGYNAGPGNARFWLDETASDDPDLFVEEIGLAEPKLYVRRVLAHYANYRRLYAD